MTLWLLHRALTVGVCCRADRGQSKFCLGSGLFQLSERGTSPTPVCVSEALGSRLSHGRSVSPWKAESKCFLIDCTDISVSSCCFYSCPVCVFSAAEPAAGDGWDSMLSFRGSTIHELHSTFGTLWGHNHILVWGPHNPRALNAAGRAYRMCLLHSIGNHSDLKSMFIEGHLIGREDFFWY